LHSSHWLSQHPGNTLLLVQQFSCSALSTILTVATSLMEEAQGWQQLDIVRSHNLMLTTY
jgi:hypothetical protein